MEWRSRYADRLDPNDPAFPSVNRQLMSGWDDKEASIVDTFHAGLSIRFHAALTLMPAMIGIHQGYFESAATDTLAAADELIRQFNEQEKV